MKLARLLLIILYILNIHTIKSQNTYYINDLIGNDLNDGLSANSPWKTTTKVSNSSFMPGDKILFYRGQKWENQSFQFKFSGTVDSPIIIGAYGSGDRPIISGVNQFNESSVIWEPCTTPICNDNVWVTNAENPGRLFIGENRKEILKAYKIGNLGRDTYSKKNCAITLEADKWFWERDENGAGKLYLHQEENPNYSQNKFKIFRSRQSNSKYYNFIFQEVNNIIIENLNLQGGVVCLLIGSNNKNNDNINVKTKNIRIRNCEIGNYSSGAMSLRKVANVYIHDNQIDSKYTLRYGLIQYDCNKPAPTGGSNRGNGDAIEISRNGKNCSIYNNKFTNWGHSAIQLMCTNSTSTGNCEGVSNNRIYNNYITGEDLSYSRAFGLQGIVGGVYENEIYNNLVKNTSVRSQIAGENNYIHHNIFDRISQGDLRAPGYAQGINIKNHQSDYVATGNKFDNNLFLNCDDEALNIENNYRDRNPVENNYFRNNIIYNCGTQDSNYGMTIIDDPLNGADGSLAKNNIFKNNLIYNSYSGIQTESLINYYGNDIAVSAFNIMNGDNGNTISDNISQDPSFIDLLSSYHLNDNSPCNEAGDSQLLNESNYYTDYYDVLFPNQNPDIGHEEISSKRTQLKDEFCDVNLPTENGVIECYQLPNIHHYKFKFVNTEAPYDIYYYNTSNNDNSLDLYSRHWVKPKTTYQVTVRAVLNEEETEGFSEGGTCLVTTPYLTQLKNQYCNANLPIDNGVIECDSLPNIHHYKFKFVNTEAPYDIYYYNTPNNDNSFDLYSRHWVKPKTTYQVTVRAVLNEEETEGFSVGDTCLVTTPYLTQLKDQYCNANLPIDNGVIECDSLPNIHHYKFKFVNTEAPYDIYYYNTPNNDNSFDLYSRHWVKPKTTYQVTVRAVLNEEETEGFSVGDTCLITTPNTFLIRKLIKEDGVEKRVVNNKSINLFPNPFSKFIHVKSSDLIKNIKINEINGKTIFQKKINTENTQIKLDFLPAGLYIIQVVTENEIQFKKIIKK